MLEVPTGESIPFRSNIDDVGKILQVLYSPMVDYPC
jgi:hypothetical protein